VPEPVDWWAAQNHSDVGVARIERVHLRNLRKFGDSDFSFVDPAGAPLAQVVLAGPNGCGKTTLLEAILLILGREALIVRDLPLADRARYPRATMPPGAVIEGGLRLDSRSINVTRTAQTHSAEQSLDGEKSEPVADSDLAAVLEQLEVEYLSSRRIPAFVGPITEAIRGRPPDDTEGNRLWRFKNLLLQQQGRRAIWSSKGRGPEPMDEVWQARLNDFWQLFRSDGTTFSLDVVDPLNIETTEWDLFLFRGDQRVCAVEDLSSGELEALSMAAPFITRLKPFRGLLLIDEPELHLHPEWQTRFVPSLRTLVPEAQVFVASHADALWDNARSYERFLLVPPNDPRSSQMSRLRAMA
jgi:AAA domain, putative AbiEii toxin, Type IV TA system/AAA domain